MRLSSFDGHCTILEVGAALIVKYLPAMMAKKFTMVKLPVGAGPGVSAMVVWFGVPPAIGVIPARRGQASE